MTFIRNLKMSLYVIKDKKQNQKRADNRQPFL